MSEIKYKVYKVEYTGDYGGGCALIAADDIREAEWMLQVRYKDYSYALPNFKITGIVKGLWSETKGVILSEFYIE